MFINIVNVLSFTSFWGAVFSYLVPPRDNVLLLGLQNRDLSGFPQHFTGCKDS